jgi:hypothetical protein
MDGTAQELKTWDIFEDGKNVPGNKSLRYDSQNNLLGGWDSSNN